MGTVVSVDVGLNPSITSIDEGRVAGLQSQGIDEEMKVDNVALKAAAKGVSTFSQS